MPATSPVCDWRVLMSSERGASHVRTGQPNQDAVKSERFVTPAGEVNVLALADGHGSAHSYRSDIGADLAVSTAIDECRRFIEHYPPAESYSALRHDAETRLAVDIVREWRRRVESHYIDAPPAVPEEQVEAAADSKGAGAKTSSGGCDYRAYGTTLLIAVVAPEFILYLQLGDGEILEASGDGTVRHPLAPDPALIANETWSMCLDNAVRAFRTNFGLTRNHRPDLILMTTDGYANSFSSGEAFTRVARDLLLMVRAGESETIRRDLPGWLRQASAVGSGDDVTVGLVFRDEPARAAQEGVDE